MNVSGRVALERHSKPSIFHVRGCGIHVVVAASGRRRRYSEHLSPLNLPYILVEFDDRRVRQARERPGCQLFTVTPARPWSLKPQASARPSAAGDGPGVP